jgi:hypothetical protein
MKNVVRQLTLKDVINQSINQFRRPGPVWAFAISWLNLLWWRVGINPCNLTLTVEPQRLEEIGEFPAIGSSITYSNITDIPTVTLLTVFHDRCRGDYYAKPTMLRQVYFKRNLFPDRCDTNCSVS